MPNYPDSNTSSKPMQAQRMTAMAKARPEMQAIVSEQKIIITLRCKLPPTASYLLQPGQIVRVYCEKSNSWKGPYKVGNVENKIVSLLLSRNMKQFKKTYNMPPPQGNDVDLKRHLAGVSQFKTKSPRVHIIEIIKKGDARYTSENTNTAFAKELAVLISQGFFRVVLKKDVEKNTNILGSRLIFSIKDINTGEENTRSASLCKGIRTLKRPSRKRFTDSSKILNQSPNCPRSK